MGIITYDAVDEIKSLLKTKWSSIRPPMVSAIWDKRTVGFMDDRKDQLIIYPKNEVINYFGLGGSNFWHEQILELEIRTYRDIKRHNEVVKKVVNVIKDNITGTNYTDLRVIGSYSKNYRFRNMYAYVLTLSFRKSDPT
jgi:hypothetical protein|tara:strand:+ start:2087 stop:2503 length:417 start_codon:yes stop_codon:yes gene_type:complete